MRCVPPPARTESNSQRWHPAAGGWRRQPARNGFDLSFFFLCRLTDPALAEVFSDHSDLIAWGKHFLAVTPVPVLARWVFPFARRMAAAAWHGTQRPRGRTATARVAQALPDGCHLQWCPGRPWRGRIPSPTLLLEQAAGCPRWPGGPWGHPALAVAPGSAWVNSSVALFISGLQEKLVVTLKE